MLMSAVRTYLYKTALIVTALSSGAVVFAAGTPTQITVSSGDNQSGLVGTTLASPLVALVEDANGNPVSGAQINWTIIAGTGSFPAASTLTNSSGLASTTLNLGTVSGAVRVNADIAVDGANAIFGETANAGPAVSIGPYSGNKQNGTVGAPLPAMEAVLLDQYGNTAPHTEVTWAVASGGGSIPYPSSLSAGGIVTKVLTLGTVPGANTATVTINGTNISYTFTEYGHAGPVAGLVIKGGNNQTGAESGALSSPFTVIAEDAYGNTLKGVQIDWSASTSGDSFSAASSTTDAAGHAASTLILGSAFGTHLSTATAQGTSVSQTFVATEGADAMAVIHSEPNNNPAAFQPYFLGLSYQKQMIGDAYFSVSNQALVTLFQNLGPGVLRLNADAPLSTTTWSPNGPGLVYGTISIPDLQRLQAFLTATNWKVLYGIAMLDNNASCASGQTNCAANEAAAASQAFGGNLLGFEIGNEPDIYANAVYGTPAEPQIPGYTWADYISTTPVDSDGTLMPSWSVFASAILDAVPGAPLTGPTAGWDWIIQFAQSSVAPELSLLTRHYYATWSSESPTMSMLLAPDPSIPVQFPAQASAASTANIPGGYRLSECNSVSGYQAGVSNAWGAALWTIDFLFENALYQSTGVNFNGGGDPSGSYSPILDNGDSVVGIGPDYYGLLAYSQLVKGGTLYSVQVTPSPSTFSAYAVQETNGTTDLILSNKSPASSISVGVHRPGGAREATSLLMTASSLTATSGFTLGGSPVNLDGTWTASSNPSVPIVDDDAVVTVPPASAQIVHLR